MAECFGIMDMRVEIYLSLPVTKVSVGEQRIICFEKVLPMKTINLSASGILLFSTLELPQHVRPHLLLPVGNEFLQCVADIIRKENKKGGYYYGCRFFSLTEHDRSMIRRLVFAKQVENKLRIAYRI